MLFRQLAQFLPLIAVYLLVLCCAPPAEASYPPDPSVDIKWDYSRQNNILEIQEQFNRARATESRLRGCSLPPLKMPPQRLWETLSDGEKALWLINDERRARGLLLFEGIEPNVSEIAQYYAAYLMKTNAFEHKADGRSPWERLDSKPQIFSCRDRLLVSESLAVFWAGSTFPLEQAVYMWIYEDSGSDWGHRHTILWSPFKDNSGSKGREGFLGIGRATGTHQGWPNAEIVVMNVFDPCPDWDRFN